MQNYLYRRIGKSNWYYRYKNGVKIKKRLSFKRFKSANDIIRRSKIVKPKAKVKYLDFPSFRDIKFLKPRRRMTITVYRVYPDKTKSVLYKDDVSPDNFKKIMYDLAKQNSDLFMLSQLKWTFQKI